MADSNISLTAARLRELLYYDRKTGDFWWIKKTSNRCGDKAGWIGKGDGGHHYRQIGIDGKVYWAHRLAWLYENGKWPNNKVDHWDRKTLNNRLRNLRDATDSESSRNTGLRSDNTSGTTGVHWDKAKNRWRVALCGKFIGLYREKEEAVRVAIELRKGWRRIEK